MLCGDEKRCASDTTDKENEESNSRNDGESDSIEPMEAEPVESGVSDERKNNEEVDSESEPKVPEDKTQDSTMETDTPVESDSISGAAQKEPTELLLAKSIALLKAYDPREALKLAVTEWLVEFSQPKSVIFSTYAKSGAFTMPNTSVPVQATSSIPTQTTPTTSAASVQVSAVVTPSPMKVAKDKSRNKIKKDLESERKLTVECPAACFHFLRCQRCIYTHGPIRMCRPELRTFV